jgi:hypothetical protein
MIFLLNIHFVVGFFITNQLHIPNKHAVPVIRLMFWFLYGNVSYREGWEDVKTWNTHHRKNNPVEGRYRFMVVMIFLLEIVLVYKYRQGSPHVHWNAETPFYISIPWILFYGGFAAYWLYLRFIYEGATKKFLEPGEVDKRKEALRLKYEREDARKQAGKQKDVKVSKEQDSKGRKPEGKKTKKH